MVGTNLEVRMRALATFACFGFFGLAAAWGQAAPSSGNKCADLARLSLPHTSIVQAEVVEAGKLVLPGSQPGQQPGAKPDPLFARLPAFCRVVAEARPSADSKIPIEIWLPLSGWNGRFLGVGNGGFAGQTDYDRLAANLLLGYAGAGTDTGHSGSGIDASWALGHPEKIADFGYRAIHEMSLTGEAVAQAFYGRAADHRYFSSCSDGGREALMEAQRFPGDYDGILAGAPAYNWTHLLAEFLYTVQVLEKTPESYIPPTKLPAIGKAVLARCGKDAVGDFLDDPRQCVFDPTELKCAAADGPECLTAPQVEALKALYVGARRKDGTSITHGWLPGAEVGPGGWSAWITGPGPSQSAIWAFANGYVTNMVYSKPGIDLKTLDLDDALTTAESTTGAMLDAMSPDLGGFSAHGGKLILYHGWNDPAIPAPDTVDYYNGVVEAAGREKAAGFVRLLMVPGMQHCSGGPGATDFGQGGPAEDPALNTPENNIYRALESWVETGTAPETVIARKMSARDGKPAVEFTRPLCAYPRAAEYSGTGDRTGAASYVCASPK
jgi:hypothetical protein